MLDRDTLIQVISEALPQDSGDEDSDYKDVVVGLPVETVAENVADALLAAK